MLKGSCLCGGVAYEIDGPIRSPRFCHCLNCRKFSGTAGAAWGVVSADDFRLIHSHSGVTKYDSGGGLRAFCSACGSPVWYEPAGQPRFRGVPLGAMDDGEVPAPEMHVWTKSMPPWTSVADMLPRHERHP